MSIYKRRYSYRRKDPQNLTGGSGDVNPQYMHLTATQSGVDTTTSTAFNIPIQRLQNAGRAQVMEILKVFWDLSALDGIEVDSSLIGVLSTTSFGTTAANYGNTRVVDFARADRRLTTSGTFQGSNPVIHDLNDGAGHGFLVGTDNLYIQVQSGGTGATNSIYCKILYRWKDVSTTEYVGIVQGQQ